MERFKTISHSIAAVVTRQADWIKKSSLTPFISLMLGLAMILARGGLAWALPLTLAQPGSPTTHDVLILAFGERISNVPSVGYGVSISFDGSTGFIRCPNDENGIPTCALPVSVTSGDVILCEVAGCTKDQRSQWSDILRFPEVANHTSNKVQFISDSDSDSGNNISDVGFSIILPLQDNFRLIDECGLPGAVCMLSSTKYVAGDNAYFMNSNPVSEPGTLLILAIGLVGLLVSRQAGRRVSNQFSISFLALGLVLISLSVRAQPLELQPSDTLQIRDLNGIPLIGPIILSEDKNVVAEVEGTARLQLNVPFPGLPVGTTTAYMVERAVCPPTCPPEIEVAAKDMVSDIVTLTIGPFMRIDRVQTFDFKLISDPNSHFIIPPGTPTPGTPGSPIFVEDGTDQPITGALVPVGIAPFAVTLKSCSAPCQVPEPSNILLLGIGLASLMHCRRKLAVSLR